jgi:hypothetical protein
MGLGSGAYASALTHAQVAHHALRGGGVCQLQDESSIPRNLSRRRFNMSQVVYRRALSILKTVWLASAMLSIPLLHLKADASFGQSCQDIDVELYNVSQAEDGVSITAQCKTSVGILLPTTVDLYGVDVDDDGNLVQTAPSDRESRFQSFCYDALPSAGGGITYRFNGRMSGNTLIATCYNSTRTVRQQTQLYIDNIDNIDGTLLYRVTP